LLEHDYLSSAEKLLEFQSLYFEDQLIQKNIKNIKIYNISNYKKYKKFKNRKKMAKRFFFDLVSFFITCDGIYVP
jgi:hypothetical protein